MSYLQDLLKASDEAIPKYYTELSDNLVRELAPDFPQSIVLNIKELDKASHLTQKFISAFNMGYDSKGELWIQAIDAEQLMDIARIYLDNKPFFATQTKKKNFAPFAYKAAICLAVIIKLGGNQQLAKSAYDLLGKLKEYLLIHLNEEVDLSYSVIFPLKAADLVQQEMYSAQEQQTPLSLPMLIAQTNLPSPNQHVSKSFESDTSSPLALSQSASSMMLEQIPSTPSRMGSFIIPNSPASSIASTDSHLLSISDTSIGELDFERQHVIGDILNNVYTLQTLYQALQTEFSLELSSHLARAFMTDTNAQTDEDLLVSIDFKKLKTYAKTFSKTRNITNKNIAALCLAIIAVFSKSIDNRVEAYKELQQLPLDLLGLENYLESFQVKLSLLNILNIEQWQENIAKSQSTQDLEKNRQVAIIGKTDNKELSHAQCLRLLCVTKEELTNCITDSIETTEATAEAFLYTRLELLKAHLKNQDLIDPLAIAAKQLTAYCVARHFSRMDIEKFINNIVEAIQALDGRLYPGARKPISAPQAFAVLKNIYPAYQKANDLYRCLSLAEAIFEEPGKAKLQLFSHLLKSCTQKLTITLKAFFSMLIRRGDALRIFMSDVDFRLQQISNSHAWWTSSQENFLDLQTILMQYNDILPVLESTELANEFTEEQRELLVSAGQSLTYRKQQLCEQFDQYEIKLKKQADAFIGELHKLSNICHKIVAAGEQWNFSIQPSEFTKILYVVATDYQATFNETTTIESLASNIQQKTADILEKTNKINAEIAKPNVFGTEDHHLQKILRAMNTSADSLRLSFENLVKLATLAAANMQASENLSQIKYESLKTKIQEAIIKYGHKGLGIFKKHDQRSHSMEKLRYKIIELSLNPNNISYTEKYRLLRSALISEKLDVENNHKSKLGSKSRLAELYKEVLDVHSIEKNPYQDLSSQILEALEKYKSIGSSNLQRLNSVEKLDNMILGLDQNKSLNSAEKYYQLRKVLVEERDVVLKNHKSKLGTKSRLAELYLEVLRACPEQLEPAERLTSSYSP